MRTRSCVQAVVKVRARLNREIAKVLATQDSKERFSKLGADIHTTSPEEFDAIVRREFLENEQLIKASGIKQE